MIVSPLIFLGHSGKCFFTTPLLHWRKRPSFAGGTEFLHVVNLRGREKSVLFFFFLFFKVLGSKTYKILQLEIKVPNDWNLDE